MADPGVEAFTNLFLNRSNRVIKIETINTGEVSGTVVDPKVIIKKAIDHLASGIILVQNNLSGNIKPSREDISMRETSEGWALS